MEASASTDTTHTTRTTLVNQQCLEVARVPSRASTPTKTKHLESQMSGTSSPRLAKSTSTGTTVHQYGILAYLALNYILRETPDNVKPRGKARQSPYSTSNVTHTSSQSTRIPNRQSRPHDTTRHSKISRHGSRRSTHSACYETSGDMASGHAHARPYLRRKDMHRNSYDSSPKTQLDDPRLDISKVEMSEAWARMRSVSKIPIPPAKPKSRKDGARSREKNVRWGVVHTREFESPSEGNNQVSFRQRERNDKGAKTKPKHQRGTGKGRDSEPDIWGSVETQGEHELWGPAKGSDGQLN